MRLLDFSDWNSYDGMLEGSGRSEKIWLESKNGSVGLFKFPKINPSDNKETTEHISEHLAYKIGKLLKIPTAKVDLGTYKGRIGCMSYFVCNENEALIEGVRFITAKFPYYNADKMYDEENKTYYCLNHLLKTVPSALSNMICIKMMFFDFIIGNSDRHQNNWGLIARVSKEDILELRWCPLYDNGSSLCCYVSDLDAGSYLSNDKVRFESLVDSKSRSIIRVDGSQKRLPTHKEVVKYLLENYGVAKEIAKAIVAELSDTAINELVDEYPSSILSANKQALIRKFLIRKREILNKLLEEVITNEYNQ